MCSADLRGLWCKYLCCLRPRGSWTDEHELMAVLVRVAGVSYRWWCVCVADNNYCIITSVRVVMVAGPAAPDLMNYSNCSQGEVH